MQEESIGRTASPIVEYQSSADDAPRPLRLIAGVAAVLLITLFSFWLAINPHWVQGFGHWGYAGAFLVSLIASATIVLPAPGIAVIIAMGTALDPIVLGIVAGIGSAFGELSGYFAGYSGQALIPSKQRARFEQIHRLTDRYGVLVLGVLAALPVPFFDFAGIIAGMIRMRIVYFLATISIGKSIKYIVLILLGAGPLHLLQQFFASAPLP